MKILILEKLARSVDQETASRPAEGELLYTSRTAQLRGRADHRKPFLSFWYVADTTSSPTMSLTPRFLSVHLRLFDKSTADHRRLISCLPDLLEHPVLA